MRYLITIVFFFLVPINAYAVTDRCAAYAVFADNVYTASRVGKSQTYVTKEVMDNALGNVPDVVTLKMLLIVQFAYESINDNISKKTFVDTILDACSKTGE